MDVILSQITGFSCNDKSICVKQRGDNKTLYFQDNPEGIEMTFNLPAGKWTTKNKLRKLKKPLVYICPPIAEPELFREIKPFKFRVKDNPNKVTISFAYKDFADIKCDPEIWKQSIPAFTFVMMHEHGHYYYGGKDKDSDPDGYYASETKCDIFACYKMLQNGFNPSQCIWGINLCLSDSEPSQQRKQNVLDWVNGVKVEGRENFNVMTIEELNSLLNKYIGAKVTAKRDGVAIDQANGDKINVKKGDELGLIDGFYGPESSLQYSTDKGYVVPASIVFNTEDLKKISEKQQGDKNAKGNKNQPGFSFGSGSGKLEPKDLFLLFLGIALILGATKRKG